MLSIDVSRTGFFPQFPLNVFTKGKMSSTLRGGTGRKLRFTISDDLCLLREVVCENPYEDNRKWHVIQRNVCAMTEKSFTVRSVREHTEWLVKLFEKEDAANLRKSGTEEEYDEKEQLLQQVVDLLKECPPSRAKKLFVNKHTNNSAVSCPTGKEARDAEVQFLDSGNIEFVLHEENTFICDQEESNTSSFESTLEVNPPLQQERLSDPKTSQKTHFQTKGLAYLEKRLQRDSEIKMKELEVENKRLKLEERRLELEEAKFELDREERMIKLDLDKEERIRKLDHDAEEKRLRIESEKLLKDTLITMLDKLIHKQ